jgi:endonuclease/exonuclease/phosphatase family metal-dependent hydrolase
MKLKRFLVASQALAAATLLTTSLALTGCQNNSSANPEKPAPARERLTIMTYNVENLFDTTHDADRDDFTYLPLALKKTLPDQAENCKKMGSPGFIKECLELDWSEAVLNTKLTRLSDSILAVNGVGPDILLVQEVENQNVLDMLNKKYLAAAKYQTSVLIEGEDKRGIDVGVLSRLPQAEPAKLHLIDFTPPPKKLDANGNEIPSDWKRPLTRGIIEVPLKLPTGETLYVFAFHFPSQSNPSWQRRDAVNMMNKLIKAKGPYALVIAGGDCNITAAEEAKNQYVHDILGAEWTVSHIAGCKDCAGTEAFFEKNKSTGETKLSWSFFDILLFSPALSDGGASYRLDTQSIRIQNTGKYQLRLDPDSKGVMVPARFDANASVGVSDHLPMYGELVRQ